MAPRETKGVEHTLACRVCGRTFLARVPDGDDLPVICGFKACVARHTWGPDDWAGRARMAAARADAGVDLDDIDREALARAGAADERGAAA